MTKKENIEKTFLQEVRDFFIGMVVLICLLLLFGLLADVAMGWFFDSGQPQRIENGVSGVYEFGIDAAATVIEDINERKQK